MSVSKKLQLYNFWKVYKIIIVTKKIILLSKPILRSQLCVITSRNNSLTTIRSAKYTFNCDNSPLKATFPGWKCKLYTAPCVKNYRKYYIQCHVYRLIWIDNKIQIKAYAWSTFTCSNNSSNTQLVW